MEIKIMKNLTVKKIKQIAHKNGVIIAIAHPSEWGITCPQKRAYSYSVLNNLGLWDPPSSVDAWTLQELYYNVLQLIEKKGE
jgi:hypothetical protein